MPFVSSHRPSIQLGLLKELARTAGFPAVTLHLSLDFARQIGPELYEALCRHRGRMFSEWLFSLAAFGDRAPDPDDAMLQAFADEVRAMMGDAGETVERMRELRRVEVPRYLDYLMAAVPWERFRVVGFSSTFQQNTASFALAARIKRAHPSVVTVFGGANFEGDMGVEYARSVECVDFAVIGEADESFPEFLRALAEGRDPAEVPGVVRRAEEGGTTRLSARGPFHGLDSLPVPDYREYFDRAEALELLPAAGRRTVDIPFESARGCWWGQKHHCTFCGLNGNGMTFRSKSPERVLAELAELARDTRSFTFEAVDNILDYTYLDRFFSQITEADLQYEFFYEVKANLSRQQLRRLAEGGVRRIQPGIESLNSHILKLMRKGIRASHNVNLLRWARYYGIRVSWNVIWGFPGEREEDYREQQELMRTLTHLQPPGGAGRIWMERFSPIFSDAEAYPRAYVRPEASYTYVYPPGVDLERAAYFFEYQLHDTLPSAVNDETGRVIAAWQARWQDAPLPTLRYWSAGGYLQIEDLRDPGTPGTYQFQEPLASLYLACSDRPVSAAQAAGQLGAEYPAEEVEQALAGFCERGLMMRDDHLYLALATPAGTPR